MVRCCVYQGIQWLHLLWTGSRTTCIGAVARSLKSMSHQQMGSLPAWSCRLGSRTLLPLHFTHQQAGCASQPWGHQGMMLYPRWTVLLWTVGIDCCFGKNRSFPIFWHFQIGAQQCIGQILVSLRCRRLQLCASCIIYIMAWFYCFAQYGYGFKTHSMTLIDSAVLHFYFLHLW